MKHIAPALVALTIASSPALAQSTTRVSLASNGAQANDHSYFGFRISGEGRDVAFVSAASNLVPADTNGFEDILVRDRYAATTERVSVASDGAQANGPSLFASISADGRFVAFESYASNLVAGDTNGTDDVFVHDRATGVTVRVSVSSTGAQSNGGCISPSISSDGRFIAFDSAATNLVAGDTNGVQDVFVHDRLAGTTERVSVGVSQANEPSANASCSSDGRYVVFESGATNLVAGDTNGVADVFVRDRLLGLTERVSVGTGGVQGNRFAANGALSADGRFAAFATGSSTLVAGDTNETFDVFVRDRVALTTARISVTSSGAQTNGLCGLPALSADGRFVAWQSTASDVVPADLNGDLDVFVSDRATAITTRISVSTGGAEGSGIYGSISANGGTVAFLSASPSLVAADTNGRLDVFVHDRSGSGVPFCSGDGSASACPCGNVGAPHAGCANSFGSSGKLVATGRASLALDSVTLVGTGMTNGASLYFQGTARAALGGSVFGDGLRCVAGTIVRLGQAVGVGGASQYPGAGDQSVSARGLVSAPTTRVYQGWYRNSASFCTTSTFNLTNGWEIVWEW